MEIPKYFYFRVRTINKGTGIEIEDASDVDVVEVVSCKDCKHSRTSPISAKVWDQDDDFMACRFHGRMVVEDDFCSWGERKEREEKRMGRMIDIEGLVKAINEQENCYVVRCRNCKYWRSLSEDTYEGMGVCTHLNWNRGIDEPTKDIVHVRGGFFCGYGDEEDPLHEEGKKRKE